MSSRWIPFLITILLAQSGWSRSQTSQGLLLSWGDLKVTEPLPLQGELSVHDPFMIKENDTYYVFSTGGFIKVRKSTDLIHWDECKDALPHMPSWVRDHVPTAREFWAPEVYSFGGKYHMYYSASLFGKNHSVIGHATNLTLDQKSPAYNWQDQGLIIGTLPDRDNFNAIDSHITFDKDGNGWFVFGSYWSGIKMLPLDAKTGKLLGGKEQMISLAYRPENTAVEGAFIVRRDGWYYLFVSFDQCCTGIASTYRTMMGRSKQITGPYLDRLGRPMMEGGGTALLVSSGRWRGPGHGMVFSEGGQDYFVHHAYDALNSGRTTLQIRPLIWDEDKWPLAGELITGKTVPGTVSRERVLGRWCHSVNGTTTMGLELRNDGTAVPFATEGLEKPVAQNAKWSLEGSFLVLTWPTTDTPHGAWRDECYVAPDGQWYTGRNQQDDLIRGLRFLDEKK